MFDIEGAKKAGYSDAEIADHLAYENKFDSAAARQSGYSDAEIISHLQQPTQQPQSATVDQPIEQPADPNTLVDMAKGAARGGLEGVTGLPTMALDALAYYPRKGIEKLTGKDLSENDPRASYLERVGQNLLTPSQTYQELYDQIISAPETTAGRLTRDVSSGITGALTGVGIGKGIVAPAGSKLAALGNLLSAAPKSQALAGATSGLAAGSTREMGGSPVAQLLAGVAAGVVAVPAAGGLKNVALDAISPLSKGMTTSRIASRLNSVLGDQSQEVINRLMAARSPIAGLTAGEVAGVPAISAMQRTAMQTNPQVGQGLGDIMDNAAEMAIEKLRSTAPGKSEDLIAARNAVKESIYAPIQNMDIPIDEKLRYILKAPSGKAGLSYASDVAKADAANAGVDPDLFAGVMPDSATHIKGSALQNIKQAMADLASNSDGKISGRAFGRSEAGIQDWLMKNFPEYKAADAEFSALSKPISQAQILEEVAKRGTNAFGEKIQPASLARAVAAKNLPKSATGYSKASWRDLTPDQRKEMNDVVRFAKGRDIFASAGKQGGGSDTVQKAEYAKIIGNPALNTWLSNLIAVSTMGASKLGEMGYNYVANQRTGDVLTELLSDPKALAAALQKSPQKTKLLKSLQQSVVPSLIGSNTQNR